MLLADIKPDLAISKYFTWKDALFLPKWYRMAVDHDGVNQQTIDTLSWFFTEKMDVVRGLVGAMAVHCCLRPESYNKLVGGAHGSAHMALDPRVAALDFHVLGRDTDSVKAILLPRLEELELRMEDNGKMSAWVHLDSRTPPPGHPRFFVP